MPIATAVDLWGPCAWKFLHAVSFAYPVAPDSEQIKQFTKFFDALPDVIPCPSCGVHARQYFKSNHAELVQALRSGPLLQRFMHKFHNTVNASRTPPVPPMDFETVRQIYTHGHDLSKKRPQTPTEWADPYHNMIPWSQEANNSVNHVVKTAVDTTLNTTTGGAGAVLLAAIAVAAVVYYYWSSSFRTQRAAAVNPQQQQLNLVRNNNSI